MTNDAERLHGETRAETLVDWTEGMPTGHLNPLTPMGEVEQVGKFAAGLIRLTGWRRTAARWVVALVLLAGPVLAIINAVTQR